jgi:hypothetical protein
MNLITTTNQRYTHFINILFPIFSAFNTYRKSQIKARLLSLRKMLEASVTLSFIFTALKDCNERTPLYFY